jgi:hypothetical protein
MKVIASIRLDKFLVEADKDELAKLVGFSFAGATGCPTFREGVTFKVSAIYEYVAKARTLQSSRRNVIERLRMMADAMEAVPESVFASDGAEEVEQ